MIGQVFARRLGQIFKETAIGFGSVPPAEDRVGFPLADFHIQRLRLVAFAIIHRTPPKHASAPRWRLSARADRRHVSRCGRACCKHSPAAAFESAATRRRRRSLLQRAKCESRGDCRPFPLSVRSPPVRTTVAAAKKNPPAARCDHVNRLCDTPERRAGVDCRTPYFRSGHEGSNPSAVTRPAELPASMAGTDIPKRDAEREAPDSCTTAR